MKTFVGLLLILAIAVPATCDFGVDVSQLFSVQNYTCMKSYNITFAIARGYYSYGAMDVHVNQSLSNMKAAGLQTDTYMFPCRGKNATAQANQIADNIPRDLYDRIWVDVETNPSPGCSWTSFDGPSNCLFMLELIQALKAKNVKVGIYASRFMWNSIFGGYDTCQQASVNMPLWYAHYDNTPSFSDFAGFGGWSQPTIKQYLGTSTLCGASVDRSWKP